MMARVHYWIVSDAVAYIRSHGDDLQKKALQAFQTAYGEDTPIESIPVGRTAVEYLAGFESWHTDKFGDLTLCMEGLPWGAKHDLTGLGWHMFTAFNHFINPDPPTSSGWPNEGYSYNLSSMSGCDSLVVKGISEYLQGFVDIENSLILDRIRPFWKGGVEEWRNNFEHRLLHTAFAPWSVLVQVYYASLLLNHYEPMEVRGPNRDIVGLQFLGPVMHAAADASSPHHVRCALGLGHHVWENYVQSKVYNRALDLKPLLVRQILSDEPFEPWLTCSGGPFKGRFDCENFVTRLSTRTAKRLQYSWAIGSWEELCQAGAEFWKRYFTGTRMREDAEYLYNQAVAGTIHVLVRSYTDLVSQGIITANGRLAEPSRMPQLELMQDRMASLPLKRSGKEDLPPEETRPIPFSSAKDLLGFDPIGSTDLDRNLAEVTQLFSGQSPRPANAARLRTVLKLIEETLIDQYVKMRQTTGEAFCPLRPLERIPLDSDLSAHFGAATFRLPSEDECDRPEAFEDYMDELERHERKAHALQLTQAIAGLRFTRQTFRGRESDSVQAEKMISRLEQERDRSGLEPSMQPELVSKEPARKHAPRPLSSILRRKWMSARNALSEVGERFTSLFSFPMAALATVVAAILVIVLVYPRGLAQPVMGLSPVRWAKADLTLMGPGAAMPKSLGVVTPPLPRLAMILFFQGFDQPLEQSFVDTSYKALEPTPEIQDRLHVIDPSELMDSIKQGKLKIENRDELLRGLSQVLDISKALMITVVSERDRFKIEAELVNTGDGKIIHRKMEENLTSQELSNGLKKVASSLLREGDRR